jgi:hypothetical protein
VALVGLAQQVADLLRENVGIRHGGLGKAVVDGVA